MRSIKRQLQDIWVCKCTETKVGIDLVKTYSEPVHYKKTVSATAGTVSGGGSGLVLNYDRFITSFKKKDNIDESYFAFIDVVPETGDDGMLVIGSDGISPITEPDYKISPIYDTKKGKVARYGLIKVGGRHDKDA